MNNKPILFAHTRHQAREYLRHKGLNQDDYVIIYELSALSEVLQGTVGRQVYLLNMYNAGRAEYDIRASEAKVTCISIHNS
jgi:hypothetical protein